jgi:hypothetical protein
MGGVSLNLRVFEREIRMGVPYSCDALGMAGGGLAIHLSD